MLKFNALKKWGIFLQESKYTLNGWRFKDLKDHVDRVTIKKSESSISNAFMAADMYNRLLNGSIGDCAFLSAMPPAKTGVATCNLKTLVESEVTVDVFSSWKNLDDLALFEKESKKLSAFSCELFSLAVVRRKYRRIVCSFGNSDEDFYTLSVLRRSSHLTEGSYLVLHLHDACLWNIVEKLLDERGVNLLDSICENYSDRSLNSIIDYFSNVIERWRRVQFLVDSGLLGVRILINLIRTDLVLVNSNAALELIKKDLLGNKLIPNIKVGHHPLFESDERIKPYLPWVKDQELVVGTFGVPSMKKGLNLFFDACRQLRASGVALRVVLAGFGWDEFLKRAPQLIENLNVDIYSDVNDEELLMLMDEVHVGVQLRLQNLGESSGVVASLVKKKIPLIVSATGAFYDYASVASLFNNNDNSSILAATILNAVESHSDNSGVYSDFERAHSSVELCKLWFDH